MTKRDFAEVFSILATPTESYVNTRNSKDVGAVLISNALIVLITSCLMYLLILQAFHNIYTERFGVDSAPVLVQRISIAAIVLTLALQVLAIPLRWFVMASVLYFLFEKSSLKTMVRYLLYAEIVLSLGHFMNALAVHAISYDAVGLTATLDLIPGLSYFVDHKSAGPVWSAIASEVNLVTIWYCITLGIGLSRRENTKLIRGIMFAGLSWCAWLGTFWFWPALRGLIVPSLKIE